MEILKVSKNLDYGVERGNAQLFTVGLEDIPGTRSIMITRQGNNLILDLFDEDAESEDFKTNQVWFTENYLSTVIINLSIGEVIYPKRKKEE